MKSKRLVEQMADIIQDEELKKRVEARARAVEEQFHFWGVRDSEGAEGAEKASTVYYGGSNTEYMGRSDILAAADDLINGDRAKDYGDAAENFERIAIGWQEILEASVTADQVALCMAWLKMCRTITSPQHKDSYLDCVGYVALAGEIAGIK